MKRPLLALVALLALGLGLVAGPHPCRAAHGGPALPAQQAEASPCHGAEPQPSAPAAVRASSSAPRDCCSNEHDRACEIACQMPAAVLELAVSSLTAGPVAQAVAPVFERSLPLFVHSIDHVPLA